MSELRDRIAERLKRLRNAEFGAGAEECEYGSARKQQRHLDRADEIEAEILALVDESEPVAWAVWEDYTDTDPRGYLQSVSIDGRFLTVFDEEWKAKRFASDQPDPTAVVALYTSHTPAAPPEGGADDGP